MDSTASRASILAKLLGFYTVEVRNLEAGTVQAKADLLVMENLFYNQKPTKTFDLKGIQGRKVKASSNSSASKTLFDSEWIEGQQRALTLVNPISKAIFQEATKADCDFLSRSNIMDYSYDIALPVYLRLYSLTGGLPGCCLDLTKRGSRSIVVSWTLLAATHSRRPLSTRRRDFRGRKGRISLLSLLTSTRSVLCLRWIAISWRVQVRVCAYGSELVLTHGARI